MEYIAIITYNEVVLWLLINRPIVNKTLNSLAFNKHRYRLPSIYDKACLQMSTLLQDIEVVSINKCGTI